MHAAYRPEPGSYLVRQKKMEFFNELKGKWKWAQLYTRQSENKFKYARKTDPRMITINKDNKSSL